jgi:hypothetical protein
VCSASRSARTLALFDDRLGREAARLGYGSGGTSTYA